MKVLIGAKCVTRWQNGVLIYEQARRSGYDVDMVCYDVHGQDMLTSAMLSGAYDWLFLTGCKKIDYDILDTIARKWRLLVWEPDSLCEERREKWLSVKGVPHIILASHLNVANWLNEQQIARTKTLWVPQYVDTEYYRTDIQQRLDPRHEIYDVAFIGNCNARPVQWLGDGQRMEWAARLKRDFKTFIGGRMPGLTNCVRCYGSKMADVYNQSRIIVDLVRGNGFCYGAFDTSDRIYKAMAFGFYLTYDIPQLGLLFRNTAHLATYNYTYEDMATKIQYYLDRAGDRERIFQNGRREILLKHTLKTRIKEYWKIMGDNL